MSNVKQFPIKEWLGYNSAEELLAAALEKSTYLHKTFKDWEAELTLEINDGSYEDSEHLGKYIVKGVSPFEEGYVLYGVIPNNLFIIHHSQWGTPEHDIMRGLS